MSWQTGLAGLAFTFAGFCALIVTACKLVVRKNRRINLPPPSSACQRRGPEAVP